MGPEATAMQRRHDRKVEAGLATAEDSPVRNQRYPEWSAQEHAAARDEVERVGAMSERGIGAELERLKAAPEWVEDREKAEAGLVGEAAEAEKAEAKNEATYLAAEAGVSGWHKQHRIQSFFVRRGFMQPTALAGLEQKREAGRDAWLESRDEFLGADAALATHEKETTGMLADHRRRFAPQIEVLEGEMLARDAARELDAVVEEIEIEQQVDRAAEGEIERPAEREDSHALDEIAADMELERGAEREREARAEAEAEAQAEARAIEAGAITRLKAEGSERGPENYSPELRAQIDAAREKKAQGEEKARLAKQARKWEKAERKAERKWDEKQERAKAPPAKPEPAAPVRQHYRAHEIPPPGYEPEAEPEQAPEPEPEPEPEQAPRSGGRSYRQRTQEEIKALTAKRAERNAERMQGKEGEKEVKSKDFQQEKGRGRDDDAFGL